MTGAFVQPVWCILAAVCHLSRLSSSKPVMSAIIQSVCRETINITKRILLRGSGQLGDTKIDQRANCPTFRVGRSAVILNIEVDMTGFREAVLITGTDRVCPVLQNCSIGYVVYQLEHN